MKINTLKLSFVFLTVLFLSTSLMRSQVNTLRINEYSCSNTSLVTPTLPSSGTPDWFELYNSGASAISISGCYLSNDPSDLSKWQFPINVTMASHAYIKIFASGKDTVLAGSPQEFHTNFDLLQTKPQKIILSDINGTVIDSITLKPNQRNDSWGRVPNGSGVWRLFSSPYAPTPAAANPAAGVPPAITSYVGYKNKPIFSIAPGFVTGGNLSITSPQTQVQIKYTVDGSDPRTSLTATLVTPPTAISIALSATKAVRAICIDKPTPPAVATYDTSFTETNTYFYTSTDNFTFPVISVCIDTTKLFTNGTSGTDATCEYFDKNKQFMFESFGFTGVPVDETNWATNKQRGFDFSAEDEYGYSYTNSNQFFTDPTLGASTRTDFTKLVFKSAETDNFPSGGGTIPAASQMPCHLRDAFSQSYAFRKNFNLDGRHYEPIIMFVNGKYWGIYELREEFDKEYTDYYYKQPSIMDLQCIGGSAVITTPPAPSTTAATDWNNVYTFIMSNTMNNPTNYAMADSMLNFKSFMDYMIYNTYSVNANFDKMNMEWRGTDLTAAKNKWNFGMWNMDDTWGLGMDNAPLGNTTPTSNPCDYNAPYPAGNPNMAHPALLMKLMTNDTFKSAYINRYADLLNTSLSCDSVMDHFNYFKTFMTPEMTRHCKKWAAAAGFYASSPNDSLADWKRNMDNMQAWIQRRCTYIDTAITASCYNVTGPFSFCLDISPASTGSIQFNSLNISNFIYSGQYFGGVHMNAIATPVPNYYFDHWETTGFTLPDSLVKQDSITWLFDSVSCLKAIFKLKEPYNLTGTPLVPTGFSPNGDGNNDILNVYGTLTATKFEIEIYNRWGQSVFKSNDKTVGWDGKFNGADAPIGVYAYRFTVTIDGTDIAKKGNITLIR